VRARPRSSRSLTGLYRLVAEIPRERATRRQAETAPFFEGGRPDEDLLTLAEIFHTD
jgi:hypothetical protein